MLQTESLKNSTKLVLKRFFTYYETYLVNCNGLRTVISYV